MGKKTRANPFQWALGSLFLGDYDSSSVPIRGDGDEEETIEFSSRTTNNQKNACYSYRENLDYRIGRRG